MQAVLPSGWESLSKGRQLRKFLERGKKAHVKVVQRQFETATGRYGPDAARFRFVVNGISSVEIPTGHRSENIEPDGWRNIAITLKTPSTISAVNAKIRLTTAAPSD